MYNRGKRPVAADLYERVANDFVENTVKGIIKCNNGKNDKCMHSDKILWNG